jgi:hypothetical protein
MSIVSSAIIQFCATATAGPLFYVLAGFALMVFTGVLAINLYGLGEKYIRLTVRRSRMSARSFDSIVRTYRIIYGVASIIGLAMFVSGLMRI